MRRVLLIDLYALPEYDISLALGYLKASVELGLRHPEVGADFGEFLRQRPR